VQLLAGSRNGAAAGDRPEVEQVVVVEPGQVRRRL
jgi:hypothetical protein